MRPIMRWGTLGLVMSAMPVSAASIEATPMAIHRAARIDIGMTSGGWMGLRVRPVSVAQLTGEPARPTAHNIRQTALGPAPDSGKLVSFARRSTDAPSDISLLRDAPRFSRLPGKQVDDYAMGLRAALAGRTIALQAGVFHNKYRNLQTTVRQNGMLMTATAGKAKVYGVQSLASWSPDPHLSLFASSSYSESRLKNRLRDGRKFRLSPDRSATVGAVLRMPAGAGEIAFVPSIAHQSAMGLGGDADSPGAVTLVNAQIGYALKGGFEIEALVSNLLNRQYDRPSADAPMLIAGEPRVVGVRARLRLGKRD